MSIKINQVKLSKDTKEAKGEVVIQEEAYGFGISFPGVCNIPLLSIDMFPESEEGQGVAENRDVQAQVYFYQPGYKDDPAGVIRWHLGGTVSVELFEDD